MKLRLTNYNPEMVLTVSGGAQEVIVTKTDGCLTLEFLEERRAITTEDDVNIPSVPMFNDDGAERKEIDAVVAYARNNTLFHRLSDLRRELATAEKVAPYLIFHDKTLWGMVEQMPKDLHALGKISGVGNAKLEKYGVAFLEALHCVAV